MNTCQECKFYEPEVRVVEERAPSKPLDPAPVGSLKKEVPTGRGTCHTDPPKLIWSEGEKTMWMRPPVRKSDRACGLFRGAK